MHFLKSNECLFWSIHDGLLKALKQFEAKEYIVYRPVPTSSTCVNGTEKIVHFQIHLGIILYYWDYDSIKDLGFFLSSLIVLNNHMDAVKIKS